MSPVRNRDRNLNKNIIIKIMQYIKINNLINQNHDLIAICF